MTVDWTDERVATLKGLMDGTRTSRQIAALMGGLTRQTIIGKVRRLGLSHLFAPYNVQKPKLAKPRIRTPKLEIVVAAPLNVSIFALTANMCRWPTGEGAEHTFCGHQCEGSYCATHSALAYVKPLNKRIRPPREHRIRTVDQHWHEAA